MRMAYSFSGAQGCPCSADSSKKNTHLIILGNTCGLIYQNLWGPLEQYWSHIWVILFNSYFLYVLNVLSAGKYIRITMYERMEIWQAYSSQTNATAKWGRRNSCTKVEGGGVNVNTCYFTILFRNCCASGVNLLWDCVESVQKMWQAQYIRQRYGQYTPKISSI